MLTITDLYCGAGGSTAGAVMINNVVARVASNHWDRAIETHSANMHFIPGNDAAARALAAVRAGQNIRLRGQLVRVQGDDGFDWLSSLSREDTGEGACELIWLEQLERVD